MKTGINNNYNKLQRLVYITQQKSLIVLQDCNSIHKVKKNCIGSYSAKLYINRNNFAKCHSVSLNNAFLTLFFAVLSGIFNNYNNLTQFQKKSVKNGYFWLKSLRFLSTSRQCDRGKCLIFLTSLRILYPCHTVVLSYTYMYRVYDKVTVPRITLFFQSLKSYIIFFLTKSKINAKLPLTAAGQGVNANLNANHSYHTTIKTKPTINITTNITTTDITTITEEAHV